MCVSADEGRCEEGNIDVALNLFIGLTFPVPSFLSNVREEGIRLLSGSM